MTYPLPSNIAQFMAPDGRPLPDFYRWLKQVDQYGTAPVQSLPAGGTAGQALLKDGPDDGDASWHTLDKASVGLGNVDNTSDDDKPVSTAQAAAIAAATPTPAALTKTDDTNVTLTLGGSPSTALLEATSIAVGWTGALSIARGGTGKTTAGGATLDAISGFALTGLLARTGTGTYNVRSVVAPAAGITVSNGDGILGDPTLALANDLAALEALTGTNTIYYRSGADTWSAVTIGDYLAFSGGALSVAPIAGTWTPSLTFGGGSTGLSYAAGNGGTYVKIGKLVVCTGSLRLSAKGTSTGNALMAGFPFTSDGNKVGFNLAFFLGMSGLTGALMIGLNVGTSQSANFYQSGAASSSVMTDTSFTNSSRIDFSFSYIANA